MRQLRKGVPERSRRTGTPQFGQARGKIAYSTFRKAKPQFDAAAGPEEVGDKWDIAASAVSMHWIFEHQCRPARRQDPPMDFGYFVNKRHRSRDAPEIASRFEFREKRLEAGEATGRRKWGHGPI